ncbi:ORF6N domain-containing protein [Clostridium sp. AN503]|uniref:ORF6N domain-containing protein n=1 Tax=Clostridium sp. AN503 TaxID=3160598 RepID=UPI00345A7BF2
MNELTVTEYKNIRVLTTQQLAEAYESNTDTITKNFNRNKGRYVEGKHYICLKGQKLKDFRANGQIDLLPNINTLYLWTQKGAFLHAKSLNTDVAWDVYDRLVDHYFDSQEKREIPQKEKSSSERLASVNNAVKILTPLLEKAGCNSKIQLLTAKQLYEKAQVFLPVEIESDKRYWDTVHIARQAGICYKSSGKPADKAINEIIRRIGITEADYTDTWESKGKWQGTVRKYSDEVIERVICWLADNDYPTDIEYHQTDGQMKAYHVTYKNQEVA